MNLKALIKDPKTAILEVWPRSDCPAYEEIMQACAAIKENKAALKAEKANKQRIASQFKGAKEDPELLASLKADMQAVSKVLKNLEAEHKELEKQLLTLFSEAEDEVEEKPLFPPRFDFSESGTSRIDLNSVSIELADSAADWDAYVNAHPNASAYHAFAWKALIEKSFGHPCPYIVARASGGNTVGVLPLTAFSSKVFGCFAVSLPYFNYGGPLADNRDIVRLLVEYAQNLQSERGWEHIEFRCCDNALSLPSESRKVSMILRLPDNMAILEQNLGAKVRAQYKQTEKTQCEIQFGALELLDEFYEVFAHNMRDLGTPVYGKILFRNILRTFPEQSTLVVAKINGEAMGTAFLFGYKDMLEIPWASTLQKANQYNLNMWMYKNILEYAIGRDYAYFDFGRSTMDAGTYKFKKQWGASPVQHYWYYALKEGGELPGLNPDNPKYRLAINVWKKLPVALTKVIGPPLVKNIP